MNYLVTSIDAVKEILESFVSSGRPVAIDYETVGLSPFVDNPTVLTVAISNDTEVGYCIPIEHSDFWGGDLHVIKSLFSAFLKSTHCPKLLQNWQFEERWSRKYFGVSIQNVICDTMVLAHILDEAKGRTSLKYLAYVFTGANYEENIDVRKLKDAPLKDVAIYNSLDARYTLLSWQRLEELADEQDKKAYQFFHSVIPVLESMCYDGMLVDVEKLSVFSDEITAQIKEYAAIVSSGPVAKAYVDEVGQEFNPKSPAQLRKVLFDIYGVEPSGELTNTGLHKTDKVFLASLERHSNKDISSFAEAVLNVKAYEKLKATYIDGFRNKIDPDNIIHPEFLIHTTRTYRSSSENPNFQNIPKRSDVMRKFRESLRPKNDVLLECDFKGAEVTTMAYYSKDTTLTKYIAEKYDMHADWAAKLYKKKKEDITSSERSITKNKFTFPLFYGSWFGSVARDMQMDVNHVERIEKDFWKTFPDMKRWQEEVIAFYKEHGYVESFLGFRRRGLLSYNMVVNFPIQSTSFHLLLAGLIPLHKELKKMRSSIIIETHDSATIDCVASEVEDIIYLFEDYLTRKHWAWQTVPMILEWDMGEDFYNMERI